MLSVELKKLNQTTQTIKAAFYSRPASLNLGATADQANVPL
jgi:hypothetical protein